MTRRGRKLVAMVIVRQQVIKPHWDVAMHTKVNEIAYQIQTLLFLYLQITEEKNHQPNCRIYLLRELKCNYSSRKQKKKCCTNYILRLSLKSLNIRVCFFLMKIIVNTKSKRITIFHGLYITLGKSHPQCQHAWLFLHLVASYILFYNLTSHWQ